ncbi:hypothetical protein HBDW_21780 [Herbaspirillum sp. DW155]|uniref:hypothetical protein n=1 Tax=Herbaspirillum sp. DW155 TaxID=3095609 RepID=UPI0030889682|nr:hypothetical protein HBDW_21780 [Herbaspirillum sp. DW155]
MKRELCLPHDEKGNFGGFLGGNPAFLGDFLLAAAELVREIVAKKQHARTGGLSGHAGER